MGSLPQRPIATSSAGTGYGNTHEGSPASTACVESYKLESIVASQGLLKSNPSKDGRSLLRALPQTTKRKLAIHRTFRAQVRVC